MSNDLIWSLIRKNNCFLIKKDGIVFSKEAGNLTNRSTMKFSGLVNKAVTISASEKGVTVSIKKKNTTATPAKSLSTFTIKKSSRPASASVRNLMKTYRPELQTIAAARVSQIIRSQQRPTKPVKAKKIRGAKAVKAAST